MVDHRGPRDSGCHKRNAQNYRRPSPPPKAKAHTPPKPSKRDHTARHQIRQDRPFVPNSNPETEDTNNEDTSVFRIVFIPWPGTTDNISTSTNTNNTQQQQQQQRANNRRTQTTIQKLRATRAKRTATRAATRAIRDAYPLDPGGYLSILACFLPPSFWAGFQPSEGMFYQELVC